MNFDFSDDQKMVQAQVQRFLRDKCGSPVVRQALEGEAAYARDVWQGLAAMGLLGSAIPDRYDGAGAGYLGLCLVAREVGASLAPVPLAASIYLAAEAILLFGSDQQKEKWLPRLAKGEALGTLAVTESTEEAREGSIGMACAKGRLTGAKLVAPYGQVADLLVVLARADSANAKQKAAASLYLAEADATVQREPVATIDPTTGSASLAFAATPAEVLGAEGQGWAQLARLYDRAAVLLAFEQLGGAQKALDMAVDYAKERYAFGRPIGSFQALKHMMADMYVALKLAESNCYYAAWALENDAPDLPLAAATARVAATQAYQLCSRDSIQVHGGMGFTWEFDCHLHYRRSNYLALLLGGLSTWEDKLVAALEQAA